ncbi:putative DNA helicase [Helianthus annuus]|nr:putative DNA helicase [Helianthus annuus]
MKVDVLDQIRNDLELMKIELARKYNELEDLFMNEEHPQFHLVKVLVCTTTLAWGVNLPARTVVIKGTQLYDLKAGGWRDLGMLDVMQIFGRAGRPRFDKSGEGIIITSHDKLAYYLRLLTRQLPIESQFISSLKDNLNAEVTPHNVKEACAWLGYTYLFIRMKMNPLAYGIEWDEVIADPHSSFLNAFTF